MKRFENTKIKSSEESDIKDIDLEKNRLESLELIGRTVGDDCGMKVEVGKKPGWRYIFKPINKNRS